MIYATSDIHGDLDMYNYIINNLKKNDFLYIVGDVIDRGEDGIAILQDLIERDNVDLLLGNHEWFMLQSVIYQNDATRNWLHPINGGAATAEKFMELPDNEKDVIMNYLCSRDICRKLKIKNKNFVLVHGCYYKGAEKLKDFFDDKFDVYDAVWDSMLKGNIGDGNDTDIYIHGHVPVKNPYLFENYRFIDGGNVYGGCQFLYRLNDDSCISLKKNKKGVITSRKVKNEYRRIN